MLDDGLDDYLASIEAYPPLSDDEERRLAARVAAHDQAALDQLMRPSLRMVVAIAREYVGQGVALPGLIDEGNLALIRASHAFEPAGAATFAACAEPLIREAIEQAIIAHSDGAVQRVIMRRLK